MLPTPGRKDHDKERFYSVAKRGLVGGGVGGMRGVGGEVGNIFKEENQSVTYVSS